MQKIISLAKRRGFVFPSSEIYGGVEALFDYGPLGTALKNNIKKAWMKHFVQQREEVVAIDSSILMNPKVWEASGHVDGFTDPLVECKKCNSRLREDHIEDNICPNCKGKEFTEAKNFNLMFKTFLGPLEDEGHTAYLRPETAQAMFTNYALVKDSMRLRFPFGIAQIGKAFRNEITTGNFIFRMREFEQMEIEYFVDPKEDEKWFEFWLKEMEQFLLSLGLDKKKLRTYEHPKEKLSHYAKRAVDFEYKFPFGWGELAGIHNRSDYDLKQHAAASGKDFGPLPYVIEPTLGVDRLFLTLLVQGYEEIKGARTKTTEAAKEMETMLKLKPFLAPVQVAILPLVKNKEELVKKAREVFDMLKTEYVCQYDETGAIGRRYRRQDEIGTPYCVTIDFDTADDNSVTLRDRDSMNQERVSLESLVETLKEGLND